MTDGVKKRIHYAWFVVAGGFITQFILMMNLQTPGLLLTQIADTLGVTRAECGQITGFFGLTYGGFTVLWGWIADRKGPRVTMTAAAIVSGVFTVLFGLFASNSIIAAVTLNALVGVGTAGVLSASVPKLVGAWFVPEKRGHATRFITPGGDIAGMIISALAPFLALQFGWQYTFVVFGSAILVIALMVFVLVRNKPADKGLEPWGAASNASGAGVAPMSDAPRRSTKELLGKLVRMRATWHLSAFQTFYIMAFMISQSFLASTIIEAGYTLVESGFALFLYNIASLVGQQIMGPLSDRVDRRKVIGVSCTIWMVAALAYAAYWHEGANLFVLYGFVVLIGMDSQIVPVTMALVADMFPPELRGLGSGLPGTVSCIGRFSGPVIGGIVASVAGCYAGAYWFAAVPMCIAAILAFTLPKPVEGRQPAAVLQADSE